MKEKNVAWKVLAYIYAAFFPFAVYITFEILNTTSRTFTPPGIIGDPLVVFISGLALLLVTAVIYSLVGNLFVSGAIAAVLAGIIYIFNYYRFIITGWVFIPSEIKLLSQAGKISSFTEIVIHPIVVVTVVIVLAELALLYPASRKIKHALKTRMLLLDFFLAAALLMFCAAPTKARVLSAFNVDTSRSMSVNQSYRANGVLMGFYESYFSVVNEQPTNYDEETLRQLVENVINNVSPRAALAVKPNVIAIMSETFTDPAILPNISYTADPAQTYRRLRDKYTSGSVLSPAFGGSTCNPEYEFLTGNAIAFVGGGMPYTNEAGFFPVEDERSLPQMFRNNGYKTVSVHTYNEDFFNRNTIYPKLGFDKSIFLEDMEEPVIKGQFVSDEYFTDIMLDEINNTDEPLFLFGISMQNHYAYFVEKYKEYDVRSETDRLSEFQQGSADCYLQGVYDADKQLGRLIDEVSKSGRPTIVLFFGDHLPLLGDSAFEVYKALGYIENDRIENFTDDEMFKMFTTKYVMWDNIGLEKENWGVLSPFYLGALTAKSAGIDLNVYYEFLLQSHGVFHGIKENLFIDAGDNIHKKTTPEAQKTMGVFQAFQYDKIFGKKYVNGELSETLHKTQ